MLHALLSEIGRPGGNRLMTTAVAVARPGAIAWRSAHVLSADAIDEPLEAVGRALRSPGIEARAWTANGWRLSRHEQRAVCRCDHERPAPHMTSRITPRWCSSCDGQVEAIASRDRGACSRSRRAGRCVPDCSRCRCREDVRVPRTARGVTTRLRRISLEQHRSTWGCETISGRRRSAIDMSARRIQIGRTGPATRCLDPFATTRGRSGRSW